MQLCRAHPSRLLAPVHVLRLPPASHRRRAWLPSPLCCLPHHQVLATGKADLLADAFGIGAALNAAPKAEGAGPAYMALDGAALENLEVRVCVCAFSPSPRVM